MQKEIKTLKKSFLVASELHEQKFAELKRAYTVDIERLVGEQAEFAQQYKINSAPLKSSGEYQDDIGVIYNKRLSDSDLRLAEGRRTRPDVPSGRMLNRDFLHGNVQYRYHYKHYVHRSNQKHVWAIYN